MIEQSVIPGHDKVILVPTDFSDICRNAINHGVRFAARTGSRVCLLHVITKESVAALKKLRVKEEYIGWKLREYQKYYEKRYNVKVDAMVEEGDIFTAINGAVRKTRARLMILGAKGKSGLLRIFGHDALNIVTGSPIPVVVVQKISYRNRYDSIVFPASPLARTEQMVNWIRILSSQFNMNFRILLLPEKERGLKERLAEIKTRITGAFPDDRMPEIIITTSKPAGYADEIVAFTVASRSDMIMMVNGAAASKTNFALTSMEEKLMFNKAQIPVLFINPDYFEKISLPRAAT